MELTPLECFALNKLLHDQSHPEPGFIRDRALVRERVQTGAGFYAVIELAEPWSGLDRIVEREWRFRLKDRNAGGYFVCWPEGDRRLCLEVVLTRRMLATHLAPELLVSPARRAPRKSGATHSTAGRCPHRASA
ncbi:hypothetical protein [Metapseudomonas furukawaii]|uniref:Uncharacterized protein n=1 Tax=Metapseudomonas furukawaii TaxID=1149133 RepID=A0AAD1C0A2_METFU|nr:hypothetical protein [Pseudomonas furukawaii]BAU73792.1 hypothetical protein KF707C_21040 [Pseudomonas furukawaii]